MTFKNIVTILGSAALLILPAVPAHAYFRYQKPKPVVKPLFKLVGQEPLTQVGSGKASGVQGRGNAVPLDKAVHLLTPKGWHYRAEKGTPNPKVSWKPGETWTQALRGVGRSTNVHFLVDWNHKRVWAKKVGTKVAEVHTGGKAHHPKHHAKSKTKAHGKHAQHKKAGAVKTESGKAPKSVLPRTKLALKQGSLRKQLDAFAKHNHYTLVWEANDDYYVATKATMHGTVPDLVKWVITTFHDNGAPITATIYQGDHTIVVKGE